MRPPHFGAQQKAKKIKNLMTVQKVIGLVVGWGTPEKATIAR